MNALALLEKRKRFWGGAALSLAREVLAVNLEFDSKKGFDRQKKGEDLAFSFVR